MINKILALGSKKSPPGANDVKMVQQILCCKAGSYISMGQSASLDCCVP